MPFPNETFISQFTGALQIVAQELRQYYALMFGWLSAQHKEDGSHAAITGDSLAVTGAVSGAAGTFTGDVVSNNATGLECGIGTLATVNGTAFESGEVSRKGLLLGGITNGVWIEQRAFASPFTGSTSELRLWLLPWDAATAAIRFGIISSRPTLMDGGTGSTPMDFGASTRPLNNVYATQFYRANYASAQGEWTSVSYAAGNFTGSGTITWTVDSGDVNNFSYTLVGKTLTILFTFFTTTVAGAGTELRFIIPGSFTAAAETRTPIQVVDNGTVRVGLARVQASGTTVSCYTDITAGTNWAASVNNTSVNGQIIIQIS